MPLLTLGVALHIHQEFACSETSITLSILSLFLPSSMQIPEADHRVSYVAHCSFLCITVFCMLPTVEEIVHVRCFAYPHFFMSKAAALEKVGKRTELCFQTGYLLPFLNSD